MSSKAIKDAINDLGRYFGIRSADAYMSALVLAAGAAETPPHPMTPPPETPNARGALLNAITGGGSDSAPTTAAIIKYIKDQNKLADFAKDVCITPNVIDTPLASDQAVPINKPSVGDFTEQGYGKPGKEGTDTFYTIDSLRAVSAEKEPVSIIQVFPAIGNVTNSDTDVVSLFLNAVTPLEMSRAVPYIDILTVIQGDDDQDSTREMSLGRWLLGKTISGEPDPSKKMLNAEDSTIAAAINPDNAEEDPKPFRTAASMEIFTSPQTMIPIPAVPGGSIVGESNSDPFRPFLSLTGLQINGGGGSGAMFSYKKGTLSLTLHDKTKLGVIAPFIAPGGGGRIKFVITYGWSHPDGVFNPTAGRTSDTVALSNRVGELIDSMRVTETYKVVNSDCSFEDNGEVSISLIISAVGGLDMERADVTLSQLSSESDELEKTFLQIREKLNKFRTDNARSTPIDIPEWVTAASNMGSARNMSRADVRKARRWITSSFAGDADLNKLKEWLDETIGTGRRTKTAAERRMTASKAAAINAKIAALEKTPDPFLRDPAGDRWPATPKFRKGARDVKVTERNKMKFVSLGKLIASFVGESLAATDQFEEVQLVFHAFNASASCMFDYNIAQFPIEIADLKKVLEEVFNATGRMTISGFLSLLNTYFIQDQSAWGYGFRAGYETSRDFGDEGSGQRKIKSSIARKIAAGDTNALNDIKRKALATAYGTEQEVTGIEFKQPQISLKMESYPSRNWVTVKSEAGTAGTDPNPAKNILKIQIYDQNCNTTEALYKLMEGMARSGIMGELKRKPPDGRRGTRHMETAESQRSILKNMDIIEVASEPKKLWKLTQRSASDIRTAITDLVPSLMWGASASGIQTAKLGTSGNSALTSVQILRRPGQSGDTGTDNLPMQINPTELSLEIMGCPYIVRGQQYFVDMGTGTTADNFYSVMDVDHSIESGEYKTSVRMINSAAFGVWRPLYDNLEVLKTAVENAQADAEGATE